MKKAFTLAEVLIVVAILGILAALVIPQFRSHSEEAKEAAAKDNLRILRQQIEIYAAQHGGVAPGYANDDTSNIAAFIIFVQQIKDYLTELPVNPFNDDKAITIIGNGEQFPAEATGNFGWVYKPLTKKIHLDWPGTDTQGVNYYDY